MVRISRITRGVTDATVLAKIETFNPGNSIKDRMALRMIEDAERAGLLKPGGTIIEGTSGNTGMGLAIAAVIKGYKCVFTTTDKQSKEKVDALKAFGAEVIVCPTNVDPEDPRSYYSVSSRLEKDIPNSWKANQYDNLSNSAAHYEQTGPEIWEQTDGRITHLVVGVGTGGTVSGAGPLPEGAQPEDQGVGHRHLRLGLQEIQGDRDLRQERDLPVHHRRASARISCRRTSTSRHRPLREGHRQGCGADDPPHRARGRHLRRQLRRLSDGRRGAAQRPLHDRRCRRGDLPRPWIALSREDVQRRLDAREGLPREIGDDRARPGRLGPLGRALRDRGERAGRDRREADERARLLADFHHPRQAPRRLAERNALVRTSWSPTRP